ncbi:GFA family protein [Bermanella sp. R86510]|uniref:GFA family protein n=1 Tax=unclassified Bermanella TaxID=2627862 RepID=UPI0037C8689A
MKGSCLCGAIEYEVDGLNSAILHCSCSTCRKAHAAAFNTAASVKKSSFRWLKGESLLSKFESSPGKIRHFCSKCGSQLVKEKEGSSDLVLRVATLDDDPGKKPEFRIWASHEVPWLDYNAQIPTYDEWEPGR